RRPRTGTGGLPNGNLSLSGKLSARRRKWIECVNSTAFSETYLCSTITLTHESTSYEKAVICPSALTFGFDGAYNGSRTKVFIENESGSPTKHLYDEHTSRLRSRKITTFWLSALGSGLSLRRPVFGKAVPQSSNGAMYKTPRWCSIYLVSEWF